MANNNDNNNRNREKHLFYLNELSDYKVSGDDPDVRGWKVKDVDNQVVGKVDNLLVNKQTEKVVYLDVEVDQSIIEADHDPYRSSAKEGVHEFINKDGQNHLIIPVGLVNLNHDDKYVYTDKVNHRTFAETKRMEKGSNVNREYEVVVLESYDRDTNYSSDRNRTSDKNSSTTNRDRDGDRDTVISDRDKDGNRNNVTSNRDRDGDRETKLTGDAVTGRDDRRGTDLGDSDVSRSGSTIGHTKDSGSGHGQVNDDDDHSNSKRTDFAQETSNDSDLGNSRSGKGTTSGRDNDFDRDTERKTSDSSVNRSGSSRDRDDEDFYNRKEFDDSNYRKRR